MSRTTNSAGWVIQEHRLPEGWRAISPIYQWRVDAVAAMSAMKDGDAERRIYEALS